MLVNFETAFKYMNNETFSKLFTLYARPKLEYESQLWSPHLKKYIDLTEKGPYEGNKNGTRNKGAE